ncbi:fluoride efflux transporter FluC [Streptomyces sp. NPDC056401]|uniref:fluoride efflux transporter FluC n=1 Tax=Streptomyces sp. NPDC056401 TaxID=3345809 RepID=UPI0035D734E3
MNWILVFVGGMVGAPLRYLTDRAVQARHDQLFPWGTFTVNVAGCAVFGLTGRDGRPGGLDRPGRPGLARLARKCGPAPSARVGTPCPDSSATPEGPASCSCRLGRPGVPPGLLGGRGRPGAAQCFARKMQLHVNSCTGQCSA